LPDDRYFFLRLLSGARRLTVQEKESIIDSVIEKTKPKQKRRFFSAVWSPVGLRLLALASFLLLAIPVWLFLRGGPSGQEEFVAKGDKVLPTFAVKCLERGKNTECRRGGKLAFRIRSASDATFFSAFSRHEKTGRVIWYYPRADSEKSISIKDKSTNGLLFEGIEIGDEHASGDYVVYGLFSKTPLTRVEIRKIFDEISNKNERERLIVKTKMVIKP
jgi:hypothetical protein